VRNNPLPGKTRLHRSSDYQSSTTHKLDIQTPEKKRFFFMDEPKEYPTQNDIAALAQKFWEKEGQPEGKAEED
jgi:hypothetical protein